MIKVLFVNKGIDYFGRKIILIIINNIKIETVDVDGSLFTKTRDGEPCLPIKQKIQEIYKQTH